MSFCISTSGAVFASLVIGSALKVAASYWLYTARIKKYELVGHVSALYIYPIKSCRNIRVDCGECTDLGLKVDGVIDRQWIVSTVNGVCITQRQEPSMALITVQLQGDILLLEAPGMEPFYLPIELPVTDYNLSQITIKADTISSIDCGDDVAFWLSSYLKRVGLRLRYFSPVLERRDLTKQKKNWNHTAKQGDVVAFSDFCGYLVLGEASMDYLNEQLKNPVPITNFRANIIVKTSTAFEEDNWILLRIGDVHLRALDACTRCIMVTVNQETGVKDAEEEPLTTLKKFRLQEPYGQKPAFGVNYTLEKSGLIHVGDPVYAQKGELPVSSKEPECC